MSHIKICRTFNFIEKRKQKSKATHIIGTHSKKAYIFGGDFHLLESTLEQLGLFVFFVKVVRFLNEGFRLFIHLIF